MSVEQEVRRSLKDPSDFLDVDPTKPDAGVKSGGRRRDSMSDIAPTAPDTPRPPLETPEGSWASEGSEALSIT